MKKIPQSKDNSNVLKQKLFKIEKQFTLAIQKKMGVFFDTLKGILFVFEQSSESDYKQSLNYVALKKVIDNSQNVNKKFIASVQSAFKYFIQAEYNFFINENLHVGNFQKSKTKDKQIEYKIITDLIAKVEEGSEIHLKTLSNLYSAYAKNKKLNLNQLPISPYVLMYSLMTSVEDMDLNTGIRMIMYNAFDINVLVKLDENYAELVKKYNIKEVVSVAVAQPKQPLKSIDAKYAIIEKILNRQHKINKYDADDKPIINHDLIMQTLNILQEKINNKTSSNPKYFLNPKDLPKLLNVGIKKLDNNSAFMKYSKKDSNSIRLVELIFKYIDSDVGIRSLLRTLLLKLQVPVLKTVLKDNNVFKNNTDPLRLLLNQMSLVPIGFSDNLNQNHKYIVKLNEIVTLIIKHTTYNRNFYQKQLDELNTFVEKMHKRFNLIQKRIKEKEVGLEKITQIKEKVNQILEQKMHKKHMPIIIRDLFLGVWKNVLVLEFLRHPEKSRACQSKVEFIDLILNNINKDEIDRGLVKEIVNLYGEGLSLVAFNSKDLKVKENELMYVLNKKLKSEAESEPMSNRHDDSSKLILYKKNESAPPLQVDKKSHKKDYYDEMVKSIKVGTWLEFSEESNTKIRAKVSWISPITNNFLLVNSDGVRLADKSPTEIADTFRNKKCNELQTIPLFDRALLKIAKDLNESL